MPSKIPTLSGYVRKHLGGVIGSALSVCATVGLSLAAASVLRNAINELVSHGLPPARLVHWALWFFGISTASVICSLWMRNVPLRTGHWIEYEMRRDLFEHLSRLEQAFFRGNRIGDLMTRIGSDIAMTRDLIGQGLLQGVRAIAVCVGAFAVMFATQPRLAGVIALLVPPMILVFFFMLRSIRRRHESVQEQYSELSNFSQETFAGIRTVRGFATEPRREELFSGRSRELVRRNLRLSFVQQPLWPLFAFWFGAETALLLVVGGRMMIRGEIKLGDLVLFQQLLLFIQWPMLSIGWTASLIQRGRASWQRIRELFLHQPAIEDGKTAGTAPPPSAFDIRFEEVVFEAGGRRLLDRITLTIPQGATIGITGPTGSGKSLLISLLPRALDPTSGRVRIGGRDVREYALSDLRGLIGIAPQEPVLFSETLAENLAFGLDQHQEETILWASNIAHLHDDVLTFPMQYGTLLGERGVTLSGGQRQRAAIGRALARRPRILILDDTLAAVDTQTEAAILAKLKPVLDRCTTILVSHRAATLRQADTVIVLENGCVTAQGCPDDLMRRPGYFHDIAQRQALERATGMKEAVS